MITDISTEGKLELIEMINRIPADKLFKILSKIDKGNKTFEEIIKYKKTKQSYKNLYQH